MPKDTSGKWSGKTEDLHKCPKCSELCKTSEDLSVHLREHIVTEGDEILCPYPGCNKRFAAKPRNNLYTHIKTHFSIKDQMCRHPGCSKAYGDQSSRNRHEHEVHQPGFGFLCHLCKKLFKRRVQFADHWRLGHSHTLTEVEIEAAKQMHKKNGRRQAKRTENRTTPVAEQNVTSTSTTSNHNNMPLDQALAPAPSNSLPQIGKAAVSSSSSFFNEYLNLDQFYPPGTGTGSMESLPAEEAENRNLESDMQQNSFEYLAVQTPSADSDDSAQFVLPSQFNQYSRPLTSQPSPFAAVQPELATDLPLSFATPGSSLPAQLNGMYALPNSVLVDQSASEYQHSQQYHVSRQLRYNPYVRPSDHMHCPNDFSY
ncbi:hypothetical protein FRC12_020249 [Ceratobasidium sp. 428]|nr:hypothetical protein FRC12_020249 [Ceratobasidium sp. 428]